MVIVTKICSRCKQEKPIDGFYTRSGAKHLHYPMCKECYRERSKEYKPLDLLKASTETERAVIEQMSFYGIPAVPGKSLWHKFADVVAWGCVMVEVKSSNQRGENYAFAFTPQQQQRGVRGDIVVLVCKGPNEQSYHVFPADHPVFYRDGKLKTSAFYMTNPKHRKAERVNTPLSAQLMEQHKDAWHLVETKRIEVQRKLLAGASYPLHNTI